MTDIVLLTFNRLELSKQTIKELYARTTTPFRLIIVDNASKDNTPSYLKKIEQEKDNVKVVYLKDPVNICQAYNAGFKEVESELFITMQDDIIIPELEPDVIQQLIGLMKKYPEHGGIGCRIQRIPNINWNSGNEDLVSARKALSAYFRIQRKQDVIDMGGFGNRHWDDLAFVQQMRTKFGKDCSWAKNLWCNHTGYCANRGYAEGMGRPWGTSGSGLQDTIGKPYPEIDPKTNVPLLKK